MLQLVVRVRGLGGGGAEGEMEANGDFIMIRITTNVRDN